MVFICVFQLVSFLCLDIVLVLIVGVDDYCYF